MKDFIWWISSDDWEFLLAGPRIEVRRYFHSWDAYQRASGRMLAFEFSSWCRVLLIKWDATHFLTFHCNIDTFCRSRFTVVSMMLPSSHLVLRNFNTFHVCTVSFVELDACKQKELFSAGAAQNRTVRIPVHCFLHLVFATLITNCNTKCQQNH
jgi:hypothetical protein